MKHFSKKLLKVGGLLCSAVLITPAASAQALADLTYDVIYEEFYDFGGSSSSGVPSPGARICVVVGGIYEIFDTEGGQGSYCLIDDAVIDGWSLFVAFAKQDSTLAVNAYLNQGKLAIREQTAPTNEDAGIIGMPNPVAVHCQKLGGSYETDFSFCKFSDRTFIGSWTLRAGPNAPGHERLTWILKVLLKR